ncbi:hypothetical protein ACFVQ0_36280 [Streptomyces sp. NPDC057900]|uniref:hypothetical protein n=1 Tax=Streptomyces sp. NPDC057900 TaxID=3346274 RepID=UPI0036E4E1EE
MYRVTRTRLDDKATAAGVANGDDRHVILDDRSITNTGALALELVLNALAPHGGDQEPERRRGEPKPEPGERQD